MSSSPRNIRLTEEALKALKVLEGALPLKRGKVVSKAIVDAANGLLATPPIKFRLLDPEEFLQIQACLSEIEAIHRQNRTALLRIRPSHKQQAERIAEAVAKTDTETDSLAELRMKLANLARTTDALRGEDHGRLKTLLTWIKARLDKVEGKGKDVYDLEFRILSSLLP
jgi:hypothetical protein